MLVGTLLLSALICIDCSTMQKQESSRACLQRPPPAGRILRLASTEAGCPLSFIGCLTIDDSIALEERLRASREWAAEAWARCGPVVDGGYGR